MAGDRAFDFCGIFGEMVLCGRARHVYDPTGHLFDGVGQVDYKQGGKW